ncbi:hypothetical protein OCH239_12730 [Roseivivax halodurans JCM 10272]|uniref:Acyltransferase 3 domain-containing protein n=1 Tax=Roseivivax halodurans JCM 10272 TaxID=1449350 RepID=X7EBA1_9RHOB|nr:acyltransferase [Roseivivax halodurans]ETX13237.1 hypothetical protein OCH239_12730 [Roseivivax halodurans JCM 10272]
MDSNPVAAQKKRSSLLDCIRALAVIMVVLYHIGLQAGSGLDPVATWFLQYGLLGVDIFFPLSGYLITSYLLTHHNKRDVGVFFMRRFFRIVPLYMAALAIYALGSIVTRTNLDTLHNLWQNAVFLTGWVIFHGDRAEVPYTITWSLSVEEFSYIILGLAALILRGRIGRILIAMTVGALALRFAINLAGFPNVYFYPPARLDSVALGGAVAWALHARCKILIPLLVTTVATWGLMQFGRVPFHTLLFLLITLMACLVIYIIVVYLPSMRTPLISAVAAIGFYSYFIYLFHYFNIVVLEVIQERFGMGLSFWPQSVLVLAMTYFQAWLSYRFFEGPLIGFGRRLETKLGPRPAPTSAEAY